MNNSFPAGNHLLVTGVQDMSKTDSRKSLMKIFVGKKYNQTSNRLTLFWGYRMVNPRICETARPLFSLKIRDRIIKVQDFKTVQRAASPRFRDSCLECRDFETGLIFSEMHHFLIDHSIPLF